MGYVYARIIIMKTPEKQKWIIACIILLFVAWAMAATIDNFIGQPNPFDINFTGNENQTVFLDIPLYSTVYNATLSLNGSQYTNGTKENSTHGTGLTITQPRTAEYCVKIMPNYNILNLSLRFHHDVANVEFCNLRDQEGIPFMNVTSYSAGLKCQFNNSALLAGYNYSICFYRISSGSWTNRYNSPVGGYPVVTNLINWTDSGEYIANVWTSHGDQLNSIDNITAFYGSYPYNLTLDIGPRDNIPEWNYSGALTTNDTATLNISIYKEILKNGCSCSGCELIDNICRINHTFHSITEGILSVFLDNFTYYTNLTINIYDRETEALIIQSVQVTIAGEGNFSTTTGSINIPEFSTEPGPYTAYASSPEYITGQKTFTLTNQDSTTIDFYLMNSSSPNAGNLIVNVFDEFYDLIVGANVKLLEYRQDTDTFVEVEQCYSNTNGECIFGIELNIKFYIVQATATLNGVDYFGQSTDRGELIKIDNTIIEVHMARTDLFDGPDDFDFFIIPTNTSLVGNVSYLTATFNDPNNIEHTVCIEYYFRRGTNDISLAAPTCATGTAGIVNAAGGFILDPTITNVAKIYVTDGGGMSIYAEYVYPGDDSFGAAYQDFVKYIVLALWIALLALALWLKNIGLFGAGSIILSLSIPYFQPNLIGATTAVFLIILSIVIISMANKRTQ